jgi:hypothetical protein
LSLGCAAELGRSFRLDIGAILLRKMARFGLEQLGAEIACVRICSTTLSRLSVFEYCVRWQQSLMVGRTSLRFFAACGVERRSMGGRHGVVRL